MNVYRSEFASLASGGNAQKFNLLRTCKGRANRRVVAGYVHGVGSNLEVWKDGAVASQDAVEPYDAGNLTGIGRVRLANLRLAPLLQARRCRRCEPIHKHGNGFGCFGALCQDANRKRK